MDDKSNEIIAITELLRLLELTDTIISIDAMGCQKRIAKQVVDGGGKYVLAARDNQPTLHTAIDAHFVCNHESKSLDIPCRQYATTKPYIGGQRIVTTISATYQSRLQASRRNGRTCEVLVM